MTERDHCVDANEGDRPADHTCLHGVAMDVHCCGCHSGFIFDRQHVCPDAEQLEVGIDWGESTDIAVYTCGACCFETTIVDDLVKHMRAHGAHRLIVTPQLRRLRSGETPFDQVRRG